MVLNHQGGCGPGCDHMGYEISIESVVKGSPGKFFHEPSSLWQQVAASIHGLEAF